MTDLPLGRRLIRGAQGQLASHAARVFAQLASVSVLLAAWGLRRYGDWVILSAVPTYLAFSDVGFTGAATNEMTMAAGRGDHDRARDVFQAVAIALLAVLAALAIALPAVAVLVPLRDALNLGTLSGGSVGLAFVLLGFDALLTVFAGLLYGCYASAGRYGEGALIMAATMLAEFGALAVVALSGGGPAAGAAGMLVAQLVGTLWMYRAMRRRVPWLWLGRPASVRPVLRELRRPALAAGAIPGALALNVQGMVLVVGLAAGPPAAAVFSTLRTMSRAVIQVVSSVAAIVTPEISRAWAAGEEELVTTIHRRGCQVAIWLALAIVACAAGLGGEILHLWTAGRIARSGLLLYLFLGAAVIESLWLTSLAMLYAINRHQRVAVYWTGACLLCLPAGWGLVQIWGLDGAALALLAVDAFMLIPVLRQSLPAAGDRLGPWLGAVLRPPLTPRMVVRARSRIA